MSSGMSGLRILNEILDLACDGEYSGTTEKLEHVPIFRNLLGERGYINFRRDVEDKKGNGFYGIFSFTYKEEPRFDVEKIDAKILSEGYVYITSFHHPVHPTMGMIDKKTMMDILNAADSKFPNEIRPHQKCLYEIGSDLTDFEYSKEGTKYHANGELVAEGRNIFEAAQRLHEAILKKKPDLDALISKPQ
ncbi:MAG: hypothetical protein NT016_03650 [Candidatus Aenigmarchaeota archaeon]|nr:hypothetical protein [Candidatus Aenigmarchaeota archaeon]